MSDEIAFLDFETTGLSVDNGDRPTEVAVVIARSRQIIDRYESLINPDRHIPDYIVHLNGITNSMVRNAPDAATVMKELYRKVGDLPIIAHNASFDRKFLEIELRRIGKTHSHGMHCSMRVARRVYREALNHKLGTLVEHTGLMFSGRAHRAMADAEVTARLWIEMEKRLEEEYGLAQVPFELMAQLQSVRIASTTDFIRDYARRAGIATAPSRRPVGNVATAAVINQKGRSSVTRNARATTAWPQARCETCEGKGRIQTKYVKRWLKCPDCNTAR